MALLAEERKQVLEILGFFWLKVFLDSDFVDAFARSIAVKFQLLNEFTDRLPDYAARTKVPVKEPAGTRLFIIDESTLDTQANKYGDLGKTYGSNLSYGQLQQPLDEYSYEFDDDFRAPFLATDIFNPASILEEGVDYEFQTGRIVFQSNPLELPGIDKLAQTQEDGTITYNFLIWGFQVEEDIRAVCDFFGTIAGICADSDRKTHEAVQIAWDMRTEGASVEHVIRLMSLLSDIDYVSDIGTVEDIYDEGDRICVLVDNAIYTAPLGVQTLPHVQIGYTVSESEIIFDAFSVKLGRDSIDFEEFEGLVLGPGYTGEMAPHGLLFPNTISRITSEYTEYVPEAPEEIPEGSSSLGI